MSASATICSADELPALINSLRVYRAEPVTSTRRRGREVEVAASRLSVLESVSLAAHFNSRTWLRIPEQSDRSFRSERDQRFRAKVTVDSTVNVTAFRYQRNR